MALFQYVINAGVGLFIYGVLGTGIDVDVCCWFMRHIFIEMNME